VSGVHGDEMSSVHAVQTVMNQLDPAAMSGTVMAVTDVSRPAMEGMQRRWPSSGRGIDLVDMNREWPGNENGPTAASRHAGLLFNHLLRPNADAAIDFHTGTTGFEVTAFNIGEMGVPAVRAMLELYPVRHVFDNPVYPGVLHNAFMDVGIPSFTPEIGAARVLDPGMIALFVEGTMNVLKHHGILAGPMGRTARDVPVHVGNAAFAVLASAGGSWSSSSSSMTGSRSGRRSRSSATASARSSRNTRAAWPGRSPGCAATRWPSPATPSPSSCSIGRGRGNPQPIPSDPAGR
jgi:predicted deacylase